MLVGISTAAAAQYTGERAGNYNSDYERGRREAARQLEVQADRNREPNSPGAKPSYNPGQQSSSGTAPLPPKRAWTEAQEAAWRAAEKAKSEALSRELQGYHDKEAAFKAMYEVNSFPAAEVELHAGNARRSMDRGVPAAALMDSIIAIGRVQKLFYEKYETAPFSEMLASINYVVTHDMPLTAYKMIKLTIARFPEQKKAVTPLRLEAYHRLSDNFSYYGNSYRKTYQEPFIEMIDDYFLFEAETPGVYKWMHDHDKSVLYITPHELMSNVLSQEIGCKECHSGSERRAKKRRLRELQEQEKKVAARDGVSLK